MKGAMGQLMRQAQKLLRLGHKFGFPRVDRACRRALAFDLINVRRVESILLQDLDQLTLPLGPQAEAKVTQDGAEWRVELKIEDWEQIMIDEYVARLER